MSYDTRHNTLTRSPQGDAEVCRVVEREDSAMGVILALDPPTKWMLSEAASAGRFQLPGLTKTNPIVGEGLCALPPLEDGMVESSANGSTHRCSPTGKRPDLTALCGLRHVPDTVTPLGGPRQKAKRITKPQTKPELGI